MKNEQCVHFVENVKCPMVSCKWRNKSREAGNGDYCKVRGDLGADRKAIGELQNHPSPFEGNKASGWAPRLSDW